MVKRSVRSFWLRAGLELLAWQAALLALAWLLFTLVEWLQRYRFSDELFLVGTLEVMIASAGWLGRPFDASGGPERGVSELPVEAAEPERRAQALVAFVRKQSFAVRLAASGLLTILIAVGLSYGGM